MRYWRMIGHYNGESQTYEDLAGAFQTSPFTPDLDGKLIGIRVIPSAEAATSLIEGVEFELSCAIWNPGRVNVACAGNGLRTVPATPETPHDYPVDLPVKSSNAITIRGRHNVATAVTCNIFLMGLFES